MGHVSWSSCYYYTRHTSCCDRVRVCTNYIIRISSLLSSSSYLILIVVNIESLLLNLFSLLFHLLLLSVNWCLLLSVSNNNLFTINSKLLFIAYNRRIRSCYSCYNRSYVALIVASWLSKLRLLHLILHHKRRRWLLVVCTTYYTRCWWIVVVVGTCYKLIVCFL